MKAITYHRYGKPEVMELADIPMPKPKPNEILVKVKAVSLNASDWEFLTGSPSYVRVWGIFKPKVSILGSDISGIVEEVGSEVTQFSPGDEVLADLFESWGGFAEYVCAPAKKWILKPDGISHEEAACLPQAGVVTLQAIRNQGHLIAGERLLINGAGGGSGTMAIQLGKMYGAEVTAIDKGNKALYMRLQGADHTIDYTQEDPTESGTYDLIVDFIAQRSTFDYKKALKPNGRYIMVGGTVKRLLQTFFMGPLVSLTSSKKMGVLGHVQNHQDIQYLLKLYHEGKLRPIIDKTYPLEATADAMKYLGEGKVMGKVVISM